MSSTLKERMRVGPKGQVVIPHYFRKAFGILPGSQVLLEMTDKGIIIEKSDERAEEIFGQIARKGPAKKFRPHDSHDEELEKRLRRFR